MPGCRQVCDWKPIRCPRRLPHRPTLRLHCACRPELLATKSSFWREQDRQLSRNCVSLCCWNFKSFDLLLNFVREAGCAGAVYHTMIERKRKRDDFRAFVFPSVRDQLAMSGADEKRAD